MNTIKTFTVIAGVLLFASHVGGQESPPGQPDERTMRAVTAEELRELGLPPKPISDMVIHFDDLTSKDDLLKRIAKHAERNAPEGISLGGTSDVAIPPALETMLEAVEADDIDRLQAEMSKLTGVEVVLPTAEQRRRHDETAIYRSVERYPTEEVLARLSPESVEALADHRHLLDDEWELVDSLGKMDVHTRLAAKEFLSKLRPRKERPPMTPERMEELRLAEERWLAEADHPAPGFALLEQAEKMELDQSFLSDYDEFIPKTASSYSFDLPTTARLEIAESSIFGGLLYAEKSEAVDVKFDNPTLHILGHDAGVWTASYSDGVLSTTLTAFDGRHRYQVTLESHNRLEGEQRDEFVRMATAMIEGNLSKPKEAPIPR